MTERERTERASTAKQIARSSENESPDINEFAVCYRVVTGLDPEGMIAEHGDALQGHPELLRLRVSTTTYKLLVHAVELARLMESYKDQVVEEDALRVMAYVNGDTQHCPDRAQLMSVLNQYGIILSKAPKNSWKEVMYGGPSFDRYFNRDDLGTRIKSYLKRIERDLDAIDRVRRVQIVGFEERPFVFVVWTDHRNVKYIAYARIDWGKVNAVDFGGVRNV